MDGARLIVSLRCTGEAFTPEEVEFPRFVMLARCIGAVILKKVQKLGIQPSFWEYKIVQEAVARFEWGDVCQANKQSIP